MSDTEPFKRAAAAARRLISHRPRSKSEIRGRLQRTFPPAVVERVVAYLADHNMVDDTKFALLWRNSRASSSPRSAALIRRELVAKGVSRDIADETVGDLDDHVSAYDAGLKFARRLYQADFLTFRRRLWGHLGRRGFGESVARRTVAQLWDERPQTDRESPYEAKEQ